MPEIIRLPVRMDCAGIDVSHPVDRMPPNTFPFLNNVRVIQEGRLESRPGYTVYDSSVSSPKLPHSIRRLNDPDQSFAPTSYINVVGNGTIVEAGPENALIQIDTGYSGNPLSLIPFRPEQSPESWMYLYDQNKLIKVRPDGAIRSVGVAPPTRGPIIDYGAPANVDIATLQSLTGWSSSSTFGSQDRTNGSTPTIADILYNSGNTGWCCIGVSITGGFNFQWASNRMKMILNAGGGNQEEVFIREVWPAIKSTTISGIAYDSGTSGLCSIVLVGNPSGIARNSLISMTNGLAQTDVVRVLEVNLSTDGTVYSIRCSTTHTFAAGNAVNGVTSFYTYTTLTHSVGEVFSSSAISIAPSASPATAQLTANINAGTANGRPIDAANDWLSFGIYLTAPTNVVDIQLLVSLDATPNFSFTNPGNTWIWKITQSQLVALGLTAGNSFQNWYQIQIPISSGVHTGDPALGFSSISGVAVQLTTTGNCGWAFDWWYLFGTYGPTIQPNSPTGYLYETVDRDSTTGAQSVPGPHTRYELFPLRESIVVTPQATSAAGVDSLDIYRQGGTLTGFVYVATVVNNNVTPNLYVDVIPDTSLLASPAPDLTKLQPWPILDLPWSGVVNVVGTSVDWVSGTPFNTALLSASLISINGVTYQTYGQPRTAVFLELFADAGVQMGVPYSIASPTLAGQPLPYAFGSLEGPLAPVIFALGDPVSGGNLYWTNFSDGDSASDQNFLEIAPPSEPLISGQTWNGIVIVGSRDNIYLVRYSFVTNSVYQFNRIPSPSGMWTRWTSCRGPDGVYFLGRDGIYLANESGAKNITDAQLYPLFPHDGALATASISPFYDAVDMTQTGKYMRLSAGDFDIYFDYLTVGGQEVTLRFDIAKQRWFSHVYSDPVLLHYLVDESVNAPSTPQILMLSATGLGLIYASGGNDDNGFPIQCNAQIPYLDGGDERIHKLPTDFIIDADGTGTISATQGYNNGASFSAAGSITLSGSRVQSILNISKVPNVLGLYRNISIILSWTGGPAGPRVYAVEPAWYSQPFLSTRVMTQFLGLDFPGWKHHRRMYPALISTAPVNLLIQCQDGRQYTAVIPSTNGQLRWLPQMLPQDIKDLGFAYQLDGAGVPFALFPDEFTIEIKEWTEPSYIPLAVWKT